MRLSASALALSLIALPTFAQQAAPAPATPAPAASAPAASSAPSHHHRMTIQQRFDAADTNHDGQLTLAEAKAGYRAVARHFKAIDTDKKGYVTLAEIESYVQARRAAYRAAHQKVPAPASATPAAPTTSTN